MESSQVIELAQIIALMAVSAFKEAMIESDSFLATANFQLKARCWLVLFSGSEYRPPTVGSGYFMT